jgi:hypothetical protein
MPYMIRLITKQMQLIEVEINEYRIARNQGYQPMYPTTYYAGLAHAYKGLKLALSTLKQSQKVGNFHVQ